MDDASALLQERFGKRPEVLMRSPGRINLIGDHTDYCGLPVLPIAISQAIEFAGAPRTGPGFDVVSSLDGRAIETETQHDEPDWAKYARAVFAELQPLAPDRGALLALGGDLPATGGLSSSSALSVGCVIALNELWSLGLDGPQIVTTAVASERAAAIAGGEMDQTVITFARPGHALLIEFDPAAHRHVPLPDDFTWIAGYSGTAAPKGSSATNSYNAFVLASRAAAAMLAADLAIDPGVPPLLSRVTTAGGSAVAGLPRLSVAQAADIAGGDLGLPGDMELDLAVSADHVLSEAGRVVLAEKALRDGDITEMGRLMNESHQSLRRYGSSTKQLDRLVAAAHDAGASGARVTGAGFGGWAIALASPSREVAVQEAMEAACGGPAFVAQAEGGALWSLARA